MQKKHFFSLGLARAERGLIFLTMILCLIGLVFVFEASVAEAFQTFGNQFYFIRQQIMWFGVGILALLVGIFTPLSYWKKLSPLFYIGSIVLLVCVFIPGLGKSVNGAQRWISFAGITLQPVEVAKFSLITFFAMWMEKHQKIAPFLFLTLVPVGLLFLQPDMGSALIVIAIAFGMYYLAGAPYRIFLSIGGLGVLALTLLILLSPYRLRRVTTFLNPESDPLGASFHIRQITLALGSGGLWGQGIGQSRQKFSYLPEASTDSIFAIIGEEIGFVGSLVIILMFMIFLQLGYRIVRKTEPKSFAHLLASGILIWLGMQIALNLSAIVALVPLTGIPLPFFSYGGSALVMVLFVTGILIGIGREHNLSSL
jgi:cell division protein FtsW